MSATQKIGIVKNIPEADKDLKLLTNWRLRILLNTFYKILSGDLANRLKTVLDHLIGPELPMVFFNMLRKKLPWNDLTH